MAVDCLHEPPIVAFARTFGASIGIFAAALTWLLNNVVRWLVWLISERRREYELIKGLTAEIASNLISEANWADSAKATKLLEALSSDPGPRKPWTPYVAVVDGNVVFDNIKDAINRLPANVIVALVEYYNLTSGLTKQLADFRSEAYAALSHERQATVIKRVYELGADVVASGNRAKTALAKRLGAIRIGYGLILAIAGLMALATAPPLISAVSGYANRTVIPAVEWASTCDLAPKSSK